MEHSVTRQNVRLDGLGRAIFENAPDPMLLVDPHTDCILDANLAALQVTGLEPDRLPGLRLAELIASCSSGAHGRTAVSVEQSFTAAFFASLQTGTGHEAAVPMACPDWTQGDCSDRDSQRPMVEFQSGNGESIVAELTLYRAEAEGESVFVVGLHEVAAARRSSEIEQLFHDSPVSLWEFDWRRLRKKIHHWEQSGVSNLRRWLEDNPDRVAELARETRIVSVNRGTLRMFGAKDLTDFRDNLASVFRQESLVAFRRHLLARIDGQSRVEVENVTYTLQGERLYVQVNAVAATGCEDSWERLYVSLLNVTERKRAEMLQDTQRQVLESLVTSVETDRTLRILIEHIELQAPELKLAIFRLSPDQQTVELAEGGCVPAKLAQLLDGRHWNELKPLIEDWQIDASQARTSPAEGIAEDSSLSLSSLLGRLGAAMLAAGFCDCCLEIARNAQGEPLGLVLFLRSDSGQFRDYEKDIISTVRRLTAITLDHERDHQQISLRTSELQSVFRAYPDVLLRLNSDGTIVEQFGGDLAGLLALPEARLIGARIWNVLPATVADRLKDSVQNLHADSLQETLEFQHGAGREIRSLETRVVPLAETGDLLAILRDVTILKQTEQALEYASERFRHLFESSPDAIFVESLDGDVLDVNPAACELHGMTREELVGRRVVDLVPEVLRERIRPTASEIQHCGAASFDSYSLTRDGREIPVDIRGSSVSFDGQPALLFHVRDATRRVQEEQQRREHERQMAHVSRLSLMGQFVAGIAHEIRQPLWSISTFADVAVEALQRPDAISRIERVRELSQKIVGEVRRVNDITSRMFSFAKKSLPERETAILQDVIQTAAGFCRSALSDKRIRLHVDVPPEPMSVLCDRVLIEQTLVNLLTNASRAIESVPDVSGQISVTLTHDDDVARIAVTDNGCGLPDGLEAERLFEGFFTTDRAGLGIGLALSRSFVEEHGGEIWAEPNLDVGMSFHFTLRLENGAGNT